MIAVGSLIVVNLLDPLPSQTGIIRTEWPQHMTLVQWFELQDVDELIAELKAFASSYRPFIQTIGEVELFGPNSTMPVNVLVDQTDSKLLHEKLVSLAGKLGARFLESQWMHGNYRAHISRMDVNKDHFYTPGDKITIDNLCVAQLVSPLMCQPIEVIRIGNEAAA